MITPISINTLRIVRNKANTKLNTHMKQELVIHNKSLTQKLMLISEALAIILGDYESPYI